MNTFGLKRKVHTFGLGKLFLTTIQAYHEVANFILRVVKLQNFKG